MFYFFDGTKEGFLTAFAMAFHDENAIFSSKNAQLFLGEAPIFVQTNLQKAEKIGKRLTEFDKSALQDLDILLRCGQKDSEQTAFEYLRCLATHKHSVRKCFALPEVFQAIAYIKKVSLEIHKLHGFIRFMETESGALYAPFAPDNDVCDLLLPHFKARLPEYPFVLHDITRKKAAVYDGKSSFLAPLGQADVLLSANENQWQALWKQYYSAVNIPERERLRQMRAYMPVRYWKFLPEKE